MVVYRSAQVLSTQPQQLFCNLHAPTHIELLEAVQFSTCEKRPQVICFAPISNLSCRFLGGILKPSYV